MAFFYELIFIARQDMTSTEIDQMTNEIVESAVAMGGEIKKQEYWGIRSLEYEIKNNKKGHYVLLTFVINNEALTEIKRKLNLRDGIIRFHIIKTESFSNTPSPILKKTTENSEEIVDVTSSK